MQTSRSRPRSPGPRQVSTAFSTLAGITLFHLKARPRSTMKVSPTTDAATTGVIQLSVPAASYDVRSISGSRSLVARLVAGYSGVRVDSWQLN